MERAEPAGAPGGGSRDGDGAGITSWPEVVGWPVQNAVVWIDHHEHKGAGKIRPKSLF